MRNKVGKILPAMAGWGAAVALGLTAVAVGAEVQDRTPTAEPARVIASAPPSSTSAEPVPVMTGVDTEEDSTHDACVQAARDHGLGDVSEQGDLYAHNGEYIWEYPRWTCWVDPDGNLYMMGLEN